MGLPGCTFVWLPATTHTHTHTHHTLVLGPSYLPSCTFVWLPATTHTHTPHTGVRPKLPPRLHFCVVASHHTHTHTTQWRTSNRCGAVAPQRGTKKNVTQHKKRDAKKKKKKIDGKKKKWRKKKKKKKKK